MALFPEMPAPEAIESTVEALARLGRERDADAWRLLVERHGDAMYRAAYAVTRDEHLAADACQEAFLYVRDGARRFRPRPGNVEAMARGWLLRVATSSALTLMRDLRRRQRRESGLAVAVTVAVDAAGGDSQESSPALTRAIGDAVADLPPRLREPLLLHVYGGLDHGAIAAALGVTPGNARVRVHRALGRLRDRLARVGGVAALAALAGAADSSRTLVAAPTSVASTWHPLLRSPLTSSLRLAVGFAGVSVVPVALIAAALLAGGAAFAALRPAHPERTVSSQPAVAPDIHDAGDDRNVAAAPAPVEPVAEPRDGAAGVLVGVIIAHDGAEITVRNDSGGEYRLLPRWVGGNGDSAGLDPVMSARLSDFTDGAHVRIEWQMGERHRRVLAIEAAAR